MSDHRWEEDRLTGWVLNNDQAIDGPKGWIQWKGTTVCVDLHCICGSMGHHDGDFFYFYECPGCHRRYAVGQNIKLIELTDDIQQRYEADIKGIEFAPTNEEK